MLGNGRFSNTSGKRVSYRGTYASLLASDDGWRGSVHKPPPGSVVRPRCGLRTGRGCRSQFRCAGWIPRLWPVESDRPHQKPIARSDRQLVAGESRVLPPVDELVVEAAGIAPASEPKPAEATTRATMREYPDVLEKRRASFSYSGALQPHTFHHGQPRSALACSHLSRAARCSVIPAFARIRLPSHSNTWSPRVA